MPHARGDGMTVLKPTPHHCRLEPFGGVHERLKLTLPLPIDQDGRHRWRVDGSQHVEADGAVHAGAGDDGGAAAARGAAAKMLRDAEDAGTAVIAADTARSKKRGLRIADERNWQI